MYFHMISHAPITRGRAPTSPILWNPYMHAHVRESVTKFCTVIELDVRKSFIGSTTCSAWPKHFGIPYRTMRSTFLYVRYVVVLYLNECTHRQTFPTTWYGHYCSFSFHLLLCNSKGNALNGAIRYSR